MTDLLIKNIGILATPEGNGPQRGKDQGNIRIKKNVAIGITFGKISYIGDMAEAPEAKEVIDAQGSLVTPGLVDCHTHLVFGGWRQHEMELKLKGVPYLDILKAGGGILSTVEATRKATFEELYEKAKKLSLTMLSYGTTTIEAKSGYGLELDTELKQLKVVQKLNEELPIDFVSTFMGAHAVSPEYKGRGEEFVEYLCNEVLPAVAEENLAEYCDVFCETGVFDPELSEKMLLKAKEYGLKLKIHADEIDPIGGGELAGRLGAASAEHLIAATDEGIKLMSESGTIAVLLPATSFYLDKPFARARYMIDHGMAVACASDFNPGSSPNLNLQLAMNLACLRYKLTPEEALCAVTLNAASAIDRADLIGSIELGKQADIIIWDAPDLNYIFYRYGANLVGTVIKKGLVI